METQKRDQIVRAAVIGVAILVPALPLVVWAQTAIPVYRSVWHGPMLLLYLPARMLALVGFVMMFYQFVLAARFSFLEEAFTRAVIYRRHRTLGKIGFLLILLHGLAMLGFDLVLAGELIIDTNKLVGIIALIVLTIAVVVAIFWKPLKLNNKQWMRIHRLAWLAFPLALYHAIVSGTTINSSPAVLGLFFVLGAAYVALLVRRIAVATRRSRRESRPDR